MMLLNLCMATLVNWVIETKNLSKTGRRVEGILRKLPPSFKSRFLTSLLDKVIETKNLEKVCRMMRVILDRLPPDFKSGFLASVLDKLCCLISKSPSKNKAIIALIKLCVESSRALCLDRGTMKVILPNHCNVLSDTLWNSKNFEIRSQLIDAVCEDKIKLAVLHLIASRNKVPPSSFLKQVQKLVESNSKYLQSLKLSGLIMPSICRFSALKELYLQYVCFEHNPMSLVNNLTSLETLYLDKVTGITKYVYGELTCKRNLPYLKNIYINEDEGNWENSVLEFAIKNYRCRCNESCLLHLSWILSDGVRLTSLNYVTSELLASLGVDSKEHDGIINTAKTTLDDQDGWRSRCSIVDKFNMVSRLVVSVRFLIVLLPFLPTTRVGHVKFSSNINDADVNFIQEMLVGLVCEELVVGRWSQATTAQISKMLVNVNTVDYVVIEDYNHVNIKELNKLCPAITFTKG